LGFIVIVLRDLLSIQFTGCACWNFDALLRRWAAIEVLCPARSADIMSVRFPSHFLTAGGVHDQSMIYVFDQ
jgi:hypothetical protein